MAGGIDKERNKTTNKVERYLIEEDSWDELADLNVARKSASSCCHNDYIYIFCGTVDHS